MDSATIGRQHGYGRAVNHGYAQGATFAVFALALSALALWVAAQVGALLAGALLTLLILYAFGVLGDVSRGLPFVARGILSFTDTRQRVLAMEEYHGIQYVEVPGERFYLREGERAELVIYGRGGRKRRTVSVHGGEA